MTVVALPTPDHPKPVEFSINKWIEVRDVLLPSIEMLGGTHTEVDVVAMLLADHLHLWTRGSSAMITEFAVYPRVRRLSVFAAGGKLEEIMGLKPVIEKFAKDNGCQQTRIEGRKGWERLHDDYRLLTVSLIKDL